MDVRPGGAWRLVMRGPNGTENSNDSNFVEVVAPERVVFRHLEPVHGFTMTTTLADAWDKTRLEWRMLFDSAEEADKVRGFVAATNVQNFDRLAALLAAG